VKGLPGNAGVVFLIDRDGGTALTLTLWDTGEHASATDQFAEQSRAATVAATGAELVARGSYEVVAAPAPEGRAGRCALVGRRGPGHPPVHPVLPRGTARGIRTLFRRERVPA
jgi:hypothetical protein